MKEVVALKALPEGTKDNQMEEEHLRFHIEEYKALRVEIDQRIASIRTTEREITIGSFAIYAWLATQAMREEFSLVFLLVAWLPVILARAGESKRADEAQQINRLAVYIRRLEKVMASPNLRGWENYWGEVKDKTMPGWDITHDISHGYFSSIARWFYHFTIAMSGLLSIFAIFRTFGWL